MKNLVIYYSHYGNTAYVAERFSDALSKLGNTKMAQLEYEKKQNLFYRTLYRFLPHLVKLAPIITDLNEYDILCLGIPVWGGRPSAPVTRYLHICKNLTTTKIICYYVFGLEPSAKKCAQYVEKTLQSKHSAQIIHAYVPWANINNDEFLNRTINEAIAKISDKK